MHMVFKCVRAAGGVRTRLVPGRRHADLVWRGVVWVAKASIAPATCINVVKVVLPLNVQCFAQLGTKSGTLATLRTCAQQRR